MVNRTNLHTSVTYDFSKVPLSIDDWNDRELPPRDLIMGDFLSTTSRVLLIGPSGLGKTNFGMALAGCAGAGQGFLHWKCHRPARVLYIDGEMSRPLLKSRAEDLVRRLDKKPDGLFLFSSEDFEGFQPLDTPAGADFLIQLVDHVGDIDVIIFDNIMSLIEGEMKEEDGWARLLPLIAALTKRRIGQVWMHHTGHDASHGYGTKTREWRMDTVMFLSEVQNPEADISFSLEFTKARERTPQTRRDYVPVTVTLADDEWVGSAAAERERKVTGAKKVALDLLRKAIAEAGSVPPASNHVPPNTRTIPVEIWRAYSYQGNVTDSDKPDARQKAFVRAAKALQASNLIGIWGDLVWIV